MFKRVLLVAFLLLPVTAGAQNFAWDPPDQREDGSTIDPSKDLLRYKLYKDGTLIATVNSPGIGTAPGTTYNNTVKLSLGDHTFYVTALDRKMLESKPSNVLTITVSPPPTATPSPTPTPITPPKPPVLK